MKTALRILIEISNSFILAGAMLIGTLIINRMIVAGITVPDLASVALAVFLIVGTLDSQSRRRN
jgi:hypothetical protein